MFLIGIHNAWESVTYIEIEKPGNKPPKDDAAKQANSEETK